MKNLLFLLAIFITLSSFAQKKTDTLFSKLYYASLFSGNWTKSDSLLSIKEELITNDFDRAKYNWYLGYFLLQKGEYLDSYKSFNNSRNYFKENKLFKDQVKAESRMIECIYLLDNRNPLSDVINLIDIDELINSTCEIANQTNDYDIRIHCEYNKSTRAENLKDYKTSLFHVQNMGAIYLEQKDTSRYMANISNIAPILNRLKRYRDAIQLLNIAEHYYGHNENNNIRNLFLIYAHKGDIYLTLKNNDSALININKAQKLLKTYKNSSYEIVLYEQLIDLYESEKDYKKGFHFSKKLIQLKDSVQHENIINSIGDIKTKYETVEKEKENLLLKAKQQKSKFQIYSLIGLFLLTAIGSYALYTNLKKKQRIENQKKELEKERTDKTLKDLELQSIDAMISGQEKERKRIAEDLHDDLGSSLATVRLYIDTLKDRVNSDNLIIVEKTESLLNETYEKIRFMSHIRNTGTLVSRAFIPAIENLVDKISNSNKLNIEFTHLVYEKSLENSLELNLFRIIQELLNNIIKHANAKNVSINITAFDDSLNILLEDDGCGFNHNKTKKNGTGLVNITKRINLLNGNINIDSKINRGTIVNIDIPM